MLRFLICVSLNLTPIFGISQTEDKWRAGSAKAMQGEIYVLSIFIDTPKQEWTRESKMEIIAMQREACSWLKNEAKKYDAKINFQENITGLDSSLIFDNIASGQGSGSEAVDWVEKCLKKIGYQKNMHFYEEVKKNTICQNAVVLIYANKVGVSYAIQYSTDMDKESYFNEGCLIYRDYDATRPLCASIIAHELLHTFGAWDLYATFEQTKDRQEMAEKLYPNDIMLRTSYNIDELKISPLTAWLVGISNRKKKIFDWFKPQGR
jgi:hypothetical protein